MAETRGAFERDLREIRLARSVSLSEVQQETRIPADVLDRFEAGHLIGDPNYNEVYLRNLMKAYASAVGLPPGGVLKAYEAAKVGKYSGELSQLAAPEAASEAEPVEDDAPPPPAGEKEAGPDSPPPEADAPPPEADAPPPEADAPAAEAPPSAAAAPPPAVAALRRSESAPPPTPPPAVRSGPKARVQSRESVTSSTSAIEASWGLIIAGTLAAILLIGGVLWFMLRPDTPDVEPTEQVAAATNGEEDVEADPDGAEPAPPPGDAPQLQIPIQVTVIAQDGPLGGANGFRVTEEPDVRRPYWIEHGESQTFSSETEVIIWGVGSGEDLGIPAEARLQLQGYTWQPEAGSVLRIDAERGQQLLDSLHRAQRGAGG